MANLISRAMLASSRISSWSARKYDRKITDETNTAHGASSDAGRYNKMLLPGDASSYKALTSHIAAIRVLHYAKLLRGVTTAGACFPLPTISNTRINCATAKHQL